MNDTFIYEFLTFFELWKSLDNLCFFEQLFHRNQSLGALGYHMKRLKVPTRCAKYRTSVKHSILKD